VEDFSAFVFIFERVKKSSMFRNVAGIIILLVFVVNTICICVGMAQTPNQGALEGKAIDLVLKMVYPLSSDSALYNNSLAEHPLDVEYPALVIDNVYISSKEDVDYFRNHINFNDDIERIKHLSIRKAKKKGVTEIPKDGVLWVKLKKGCSYSVRPKND